MSSEAQPCARFELGLVLRFLRVRYVACECVGVCVCMFFMHLLLWRRRWLRRLECHARSHKPLIYGLIIFGVCMCICVQMRV